MLHICISKKSKNKLIEETNMTRKMTFLEYLEAEEAKGNEPTATTVVELTNHQFGNNVIADNILSDWLEHEAEELHEDCTYHFHIKRTNKATM